MFFGAFQEPLKDIMDIHRGPVQFYVDQWAPGRYNQEFWTSVYQECKWEEDVTNFLERHAKTNNVGFLDIGAWIGPHVLFYWGLLRVLGQTGNRKIVAVEPDPVARNVLKTNLRLNGIPFLMLDIQGHVCENEGNITRENADVVIVPFCVSHSSGTQVSFGPRSVQDEWGNSTTSVNGKHEDAIQIETVDMAWLCMHGFGSLDAKPIVKVDIEGFEQTLLGDDEKCVKFMSNVAALHLSIHEPWFNHDGPKMADLLKMIRRATGDSHDDMLVNTVDSNGFSTAIWSTNVSPDV